jgi:hypothetical protein
MSLPAATSQSIPEVPITLCFAPWDVAILNVSLFSAANRIEPLLQYWQGFHASEILNHLISGTKDSSRPLLSMKNNAVVLEDLYRDKGENLRVQVLLGNNEARIVVK